MRHRGGSSGWAGAWPGSLAGRLAILLTSFIVVATVAVVFREYGAGEDRLVDETVRILESQAEVAADRLEGALQDRQRLVQLWAALGTSQDLAVDDVDKRVSESLADLVETLGGGTEAVAGRADGRVLAASDPARMEAGAASLPPFITEALTATAAGVTLVGRPGGGVVVATADVVSQVNGSMLGRVVVWTPLRNFMAAAVPLSLDAVEVVASDGTVLLHGERLGEPEADYLWGAHRARTLGGSVDVSVGRPREEVARAIRSTGRQLVTLAVVFLLLALPTALVVVWSATSGLGSLTRAAQELDARRPGPLPPASPWAPMEVRVLADAMSNMVTRLEEAREELARKESLAAVGMLTKSLAHEIRTPLSVLRAGTEILARSPHAGPREREVSGMLEAEVERLARLVDDLLVFGRPSPPAVRDMDLRAVCQGALDALRSDAEEKGVALTLEGAVAPMQGDPDQLRQVVVNLAVNAVRACEGGGSVTVRTRQDPDGVTLEVVDTGTGIPPERLEEIWTPLVTTHPSGNGLGLPIVRQLVEAHGGTIGVRSTPGEGTCMTVALPNEPREEA